MVPPDRRHMALGILFGFLVANLWAGWMVVSRYGATHDLTAPDITFLRFLAAGLVTLPIFIIRWHEIRRLGWRGLFIMAAFGGVPYSITSVAGMELAPAAQAAVVITGSLPVFATLLAWAWLRERPGGLRWIGLALVLCALALIGLEGELTGTWAGYGLFLAASAMWAAFTVGTRVYGLRPMSNVAVISVISLIWYTPLFLAWGASSLGDAGFGDIGLQFVYQGLIAGVLAPIMYTRAIHSIGAPRAALIMVLVPVLTPILGWLFLAEVPGWLTIAGIFLVLPGMAMAGGVVDALTKGRRK
ncbi:MAG: DMT family transporter [Pseudomonadota bacterium]